jgi:hypothetical protein
MEVWNMKRVFLSLALALVVPAQALAATGFAVSPHRIDFGQQQVTGGFSAPVEITVTNNTGRAQQLVDYRVSDLNHFNPIAAADNSCYAYQDAASPLAPGASCNFAVSMVLTEAGRFKATFQSFWLDSALAQTTTRNVALRGTVQ